MSKKREDRVRQMQKELQDLQQVEQSKLDGTLDLATFREELTHRAIASTDEFHKKIQSLQVKLKIKKDEIEPEQHLSHSQMMDQKYHLLSIADALLTPEEVKTKRIQKMQKTAAMMREDKKAQALIESEELEKLKNSDKKTGYLKELYSKRLDILSKMTERSKRKEDFSKRRTQQSMQRMKQIVELGKEEKLPQDQVNKDTTNDNFGLNDQDWEIYKELNKDGDSEAEE